MTNVLIKEIELSAHILSFIFILFGLIFFLPGYPILCGAFFTTLGIYQSFQNIRENNDILFSTLLPISKKDVVKGKYLFVCLIEFCSFLLMFISTIIRMTILQDINAYNNNALMNANFFALAITLLIFGLFNLIFVNGFFKTAYKIGKPFILYTIICFVTIGIVETLHHIPGFELLNSFGFDNLSIQITLLIVGIIIFILLTTIAYIKSCKNFEIIDL